MRNFAYIWNSFISSVRVFFCSIYTDDETKVKTYFKVKKSVLFLLKPIVRSKYASYFYFFDNFKHLNWAGQLHAV